MTTTAKDAQGTAAMSGTAEATSTPGDQPLRQIQTALRGLRYGTVTAVVHDGVIVQVERTERVRLDRQGRSE